MVFSYRNFIIHLFFFFFFFMMEMGLGIFFEKEMWDFMKQLIVVFFVAIGLIAFRISKMYMESVCMAEAIFRTFGWPDVEKIDLRKTSKENPGEYKILGFGERYFRYNIPLAT